MLFFLGVLSTFTLVYLGLVGVRYAVSVLVNRKAQMKPGYRHLQHKKCILCFLKKAIHTFTSNVLVDVAALSARQN